MGTDALTQLELQELYEAKEEHIIKLHRRATDSYRVEGPRRKLLWAMYREAETRFAMWKEENGFKPIPPFKPDVVKDEFAEMEKEDYEAIYGWGGQGC
jgi:hypothetical protein